MSDELKLCPLCGAEIEYERHLKRHPIDFHITPDIICPLSGMYINTSISALNGWQNRPIEDALKSRIAELEAEADAEHKKLVEIADEYRAYMAANRWIPVEERLPEVGKIVIASSPSWSWFEAKKYANGWWNFAADDSADNVTHWKEITPPEVQHE